VEAPERCLRVSVGQSVTRAGDFEAHPSRFHRSLSEAMNGGIWVTP